MRNVRLRIDRAGRIVIPKEFREDLGVAAGDEVTLVVEPGGILVTTLGRSLRAMRSLVARHRKGGVSMVDDFLEWKRREAAREEEAPRVRTQ